MGSIIKKRSLLIVSVLLAVMLALSTVMAGIGGNSVYGATKNYIGETKAKNIALKDAGVKSSAVDWISVFLDWDDGFVDYDIEFIKDGVEYEYEVNALTGTILGKSKEKEASFLSLNGNSMMDRGVTGGRYFDKYDYYDDDYYEDCYDDDYDYDDRYDDRDDDDYYDYDYDDAYDYDDRYDNDYDDRYDDDYYDYDYDDRYDDDYYDDAYDYDDDAYEYDSDDDYDYDDD